MATLGFDLEWYDPLSDSTQKLFLKYFLDNNTIELLHSEMTNAFLKRIFYPQVTLEDLFLGNSIMIYNRLMTIKSYANSATKDFMERRESHFLCVIPGSNTSLLGNLLRLGKQYHLNLARVITANATLDIANGIAVRPGDILLEQVSTSVVDSSEVIRALKASGPGINISQQSSQGITEICSSFPRHFAPSNCTVCVIKPHVLKDHLAGDAISAILDEGFVIEAMLSFHLSLNMAENLFHVYRNIYSAYVMSLEHICSGPVIALAISKPGSPPRAVQDFREFCGPLEPSLAKLLRPRSLRALFGKDTVRNAVHCTDLPEDGEMESKYFFETIANL